MSLPTIILVGGGGHCISCIDVIKATGKFIIAGIIDREEKRGMELLTIPVIGTDDDLSTFGNKYDYFLVTVGQIKNPAVRISLFEKLKQLQLKSPVIHSPLAYVSSYATIDEGTIIMHGAIVNAAATVGKNCIINTNAIIEHEAVIKDHCHISTAAVCNGQVEIGKGVFIGSNATLHQGIHIGDYAVVGAGAVVLKDVFEREVIVGNPGVKK